MSAAGVIFLWDAGPGSGTAGTAEGAFEMAGPYVRDGHEGTVEEAGVCLLPSGGGFVSEHVRTGRAWRGTLEGGAPSWAEAAGRAAGALAGGEP